MRFLRILLTYIIYRDNFINTFNGKLTSFLIFLITVARVSLPEYWLLLTSKKASIIPMMSFTRDTASVHKLEPKKKTEEF